MKFLVICLLALVPSLWAQEHLTPNDVRDTRPETYALTGVTLHVDAETTLTNATLLVSKGTVVAAGTNVSLPSECVTYDATGRHVYPSFIDPFSEYGMPEQKKKSGGNPFGEKEQMFPAATGAASVNDAIKAHVRAADLFQQNEDAAKDLRAAGFGVVHSLQRDGIARGMGCLVTLRDGRDGELLLNTSASANFSLAKGSSTQAFPASPMGALALLRQTHHDAAWYAGLKKRDFTDNALEAWNAGKVLPHFFEASSWKDILRVNALGKEIGTSYIVKTNGDEYRYAKDVAATGCQLIVPLVFPEAMDVKDPLDSEKVGLSDLRHWALAPANAAELAKAGVTFAFTGQGLKDIGDLRDQVRTAIKHGLTEAQALNALTRNPAAMLKADTTLGQLKPGFFANFLVCDGSLFAEKTQILENWVQGKRYILVDTTARNLAGTYTLDLGKGPVRDLVVTGVAGDYSATFDAEASAAKTDDAKADKKPSMPKVSLRVDGALITLWWSGKGDVQGARLSGWLAGSNIEGTVAHEDGTTSRFVATSKGPAKEDKDNEDTDQPAKAELTYPITAYGWKEQPAQETLLIQNATVWTNGPDGILKDADVLVKAGKIVQVGKDLTAEGARTIDATGKHVTAGIIDEHSHIALDSTNEVAANSGMVRMGDVIDNEDVNIYRNLAGGVTAVQLLHGSANPIGGQSALIKLRWGATPDAMRIEGADPFIKFALGENVKKSFQPNSIRYPQTRMGVEQVYRDAFTNAQQYQKSWQEYLALSGQAKADAVAPRKDMALEAMVEILNGKRFITCHSYVQSEINMLMHLATEFGFKVNTFTHILEGYKVADKMAKHGVGGSTFSDWWAYKWEVLYAIPYNPAMMHKAGVTVAINSDSAEMSRRLNQEAAKAVKYGGVSEEDALKMVTLNPAKLLHLDDRMGSVEAKKDADLVVWTDHPLSIAAQVQTTLVDGRIYFDRERDAALQAEQQKERAYLLGEMVKAAKGGGGPASGGEKPEFHCDTVFEWQGGE